MKAIIDNKITYKVTGERGDFFITENSKGKGKVFLKKEVEVIEVDGFGKEKTFKKNTSNSKPIISTSLIESELNNSCSGRRILSRISENVTEIPAIITSILDQANRNSGHISEKQIFVIAKFMSENKINTYFA